MPVEYFNISFEGLFTIYSCLIENICIKEVP